MPCWIVQKANEEQNMDKLLRLMDTPEKYERLVYRITVITLALTLLMGLVVVLGATFTH